MFKIMYKENANSKTVDINIKEKWDRDMILGVLINNGSLIMGCGWCR
jgi:hypothetical protein